MLRPSTLPTLLTAVLLATQPLAAQSLPATSATAPPPAAVAGVAPPPPPLVVDVIQATRVVDPADVRAAIARELQRAAVAPDAPDLAAAQGRLTLTIRAGAQITLVYRDALGRVVQRAVALPRTTPAVLEMITLLAGNLVRNEAREVAASIVVPRRRRGQQDVEPYTPPPIELRASPPAPPTVTPPPPAPETSTAAAGALLAPAAAGTAAIVGRIAGTAGVLRGAPAVVTTLVARRPPDRWRDGRLGIYTAVGAMWGSWPIQASLTLGVSLNRLYLEYTGTTLLANSGLPHERAWVTLSAAAPLTVGPVRVEAGFGVGFHYLRAPSMDVSVMRQTEDVGIMLLLRGGVILSVVPGFEVFAHVQAAGLIESQFEMVLAPSLGATLRF